MIQRKSVSDLRIGMCTSCQSKFNHCKSNKKTCCLPAISTLFEHFILIAALSNRPDKLQSHCMVYFNLLYYDSYSISVYHFPFASIQSINFNFDFNLTKIQFGCAFWNKWMVYAWWNCYHFTNCIRSLLIRCLHTQNISAYVVNMRRRKQAKKRRKAWARLKYQNGWNIIGNSDIEENDSFDLVQN